MTFRIVWGAIVGINCVFGVLMGLEIVDRPSPLVCGILVISTNLGILALLHLHELHKRNLSDWNKLSAAATENLEKWNELKSRIDALQNKINDGEDWKQ